MRYLACAAECFLDTPTGSARVAWDIANLLAEQGHAVTLACFIDAQRQSPPQTLSQERGVRVLRVALDYANRPRNSLPFFIEQMRRGITAALGGESWDVVHSHLPHLYAALDQAVGPQPRHVYTFHSPIVDEMHIQWRHQGVRGLAKRLLGTRYLLRLEGRAVHGAATVQVLSQYSRRAVERYHGPAPHIAVVPHWRRDGLVRRHGKTEARRALGWPAELPVLFTVRRHVERMGLDVAVEAIAPLVAAGRCMFVVAGDGPLRSALEARARALGAEGNRMPFPGRLDEAQLHLAYEAADLFVLPTRALECFGLITLEAMSFGCPVLGTDAGATPELLEPVSPELIVPAGNVPALHAKVEALLTGSTALPSAAKLVDYVAAHFDRTAVTLALTALICGGATQAK